MLGAADVFAGVAGAVHDDRGLLHVGNPLREQQLLERGAALAALGDRAVVTVAGPDRLSWLDSLTSQAVAGLQPGESTELLVLDPNGRVEHAASVVDDGETTWLITDADRVAALTTWLTRMRFRLRVEITDRSAETAVVGGATSAVADLTARAVWRDPWPDVTVGGWGYAASEGHPATGRDWAEAVVDTSELERLAAQVRAGERAIAGRLAADALRIAAWRPRPSAEADGMTLPHEVDWLRTAVHLSKGCYRGQETVAKVHNLGHPPRRLVALQLDGSDAVLPEPGASVHHGDDEVGRITSVARHFEQGPIALALVKRSVPVDAPLVVQVDDEAVAAVQETVVPPTAGREAAPPRLPRLSRRT
ncbi:CAF17-like 4Fe-4S cluster assembly/insertion protein YgfZ [Microbacterium imperiale]|uniref:Folate-binding protein n=1 Tax=Microbacterium imperiale TaxID=33884 RepID=A0A9W6HFV0_9MICO|nr:folate-binding protein YgfZ [Microbacterium imperiale]MBP2422037.1 folate-binding protein YgfZ [Microbacterium imperiale]MDS0200194.1 folate-binding protein [Microbacterium imperiale]BFE39344.1 folate-binding protein YgfZ [Microbacterium imperiale]GLJ79789.1 folate-binding protein [Microbacterium imperiale]